MNNDYHRATSVPGIQVPISGDTIPNWAINNAKILMGVLTILTIVGGIWLTLRNGVSDNKERISNHATRLTYIEDQIPGLARKTEIDLQFQTVLLELREIRNSLNQQIGDLRDDMSKQWDMVSEASRYEPPKRRRR